MKIVPVIFEDHLLGGMRPLTWTTPVFEVRCGMFNTRERVDLVTGGSGGVLLGRHVLAGLNMAAHWSWGPGEITAAGKEDCRFLFLNGLLAPDFRLVRDLVALGEQGSEFVWRNENGLVAALLDGDGARALAGQWESWEQDCFSRGQWADTAQPPEVWTADIPKVAPIASAQLGDLPGIQAAAPRWIWDLVPRTAVALTGDLDFVRQGLAFCRQPFGVVPLGEGNSPDWLQETTLKEMGSAVVPEHLARLVVDDPGRVFLGQAVTLAAGTAIDTTSGPVILDRGVKVMPHCFLEGPLYVGPGSLVKPGTRLHGESSFGIVNRLAGEIGESTFGDFANKQHEGFIGHAVLGSWINLGAMTTCSDLKNNYGEIRVDLGSGAVATGSRFVGLMLGDHVKTAIGSLFNTGTCVGVASNIFGTGMPPKFVGHFQWGGQVGCPRYAVDRARATAEVAMSRRGCRFTVAHGELFDLLGG